MPHLYDPDDPEAGGFIQPAGIEGAIRTYFGRDRSEGERLFLNLNAMSETVAVHTASSPIMAYFRHFFERLEISVATWPITLGELDQHQVMFLARDPKDIIAILEWVRLSGIAHRISDLYRIIQDQSCEETEIAVESLRNLALFFLDNPLVSEPEPEVVVGPGGVLMAEWYSDSHGIVAMSFQANGMIEFAAMSAASTVGPESLVRGTLPRHKVLGAVATFLS